MLSVCVCTCSSVYYFYTTNLCIGMRLVVEERSREDNLCGGPVSVSYQSRNTKLNPYGRCILDGHVFSSRRRMPSPAHTCIDRDDGISRDMVVVAAVDYRKQCPAILVARPPDGQGRNMQLLYLRTVSSVNASPHSHGCQSL